MADVFIVFLNEQIMKTKTETNKQTKSDISTSERQPSTNGCQHLTHTQSYVSGTGACGLLFLSLFGLLSINQAAEQKKKTQTNKQNKTNKKKETHQELVFQWVFFSFFFFKVFTECAFYAQRSNPTNKTSSVNTASLKNNYSNDMFPFCQPKRAASKKYPRVLFSSKAMGAEIMRHDYCWRTFESAAICSN